MDLEKVEKRIVDPVHMPKGKMKQKMFGSILALSEIYKQDGGIN